MAKAFQNMLECFGLTQKILTFNTDNATANDKQTTKLSAWTIHSTRLIEFSASTTLYNHLPKPSCNPFIQLSLGRQTSCQRKIMMSH